jgi:hypothetical protein
MPIYLNLHGDSGIASYEIGPDFIDVVFMRGVFRHYSYTYARPGAIYVEEMKKLAVQGCGLNEYIKRNPAINNGYASRR